MSMQNRSKTFNICAIVIVACVVMAIADGVLKADYFTKSITKIIIFLGLPLIYSRIDKDIDIKHFLTVNKRGLLPAILLGIGVYAVILSAYLLFKDVFDFSGITSSLTGNIGVNGDNFIFVSVYISFVNSLLEEFFFRGFAFLTLKRISNLRFAYIFSALTFAMYHVAMMIGWFSVSVFSITLIGLLVGGLIFDYLNVRNGTIYSSWLVHMFANFAINTIGFILFGII